MEAGALCLDFSNTVNWHASDHPEDRLRVYSDLLAWALAAGLLPAGEVEHLRQVADQQPAEAAGAFGRAIELREGIYGIFSALAAGLEVNGDDLALLNRELKRSLTHLRIVSSPSGLDWGWDKRTDALDQVVWPVARSAAELLTSAEELDRVRECADDRGCGYLFIDQSRNRSRRWCSMESCGNRAKARRHYQRVAGND